MNTEEVFVTIIEGNKVTKKTIKAEEKPIEKLPPKPKDKFDLVLEEIQDVSKNLKRCEGKIDKLKEEKK
ncbi:hypothetical protein ES702_07382 [subsurface metagenome]